LAAPAGAAFLVAPYSSSQAGFGRLAQLLRTMSVWRKGRGGRQKRAIPADSLSLVSQPTAFGRFGKNSVRGWDHRKPSGASRLGASWRLVRLQQCPGKLGPSHCRL